MASDLLYRRSTAYLFGLLHSRVNERYRYRRPVSGGGSVVTVVGMIPVEIADEILTVLTDALDLDAARRVLAAIDAKVGGQWATLNLHPMEIRSWWCTDANGPCLTPAVHTEQRRYEWYSPAFPRYVPPVSTGQNGI